MLGVLVLLMSVCTTGVVAGGAGYLSADAVNGVFSRLVNDPGAMLDVVPPPGIEAIPAPSGPLQPNPGGAGGADDVGAIAARVSPATVELSVDQHYHADSYGGTGMVLTSTGLLLTDEHVITEADTITAEIGGTGRTYRVALIGVDLANDVALLQMERASGLRTVTLGRSSSAAVGDRVVVVGYPGDAGPSTITGWVTGLDDAVDVDVPAADRGTSREPKIRYSGMLRTDARTRAGVSGGPVADVGGRVIGMAQVGGNDEDFDIPIDRALASARQIAAGHASADVVIGAPAELGVLARTWNTSGRAPGAKVVTVYPHTPARSISLQEGDLILAIDTAAIASGPELRQVLSRYHPGDRAGVTWIDSRGQEHTVKVTLGTGPAP